MHLRLLPVLIVTAVIGLTARVGDLWEGIGSLALAQTASLGEAAAGEATPKAGTAAQGAQQGVDHAADPTRPEAESRRTLDLPADPLSLSDEEIDLLQSLAERRRELDLWARQIDRREALLKAAEERIEQKTADLKAVQKSIEELLLKQEEQAEDQYKSLVKIYESMKPKDAARIFDELDMVVLLPVVERMKERKTAPILAEMNPAKAKAITTQLAHRRDLPNEKDLPAAGALPPQSNPPVQR